MLYGKEPEPELCTPEAVITAPARKPVSPAPDAAPGSALKPVPKPARGTLLSAWKAPRPPNPKAPPRLPAPPPDTVASAPSGKPRVARVSAKQASGQHALAVAQGAHQARVRSRGAEADERHEEAFALRPKGKVLSDAKQADANARLSHATEKMLWSAGSAPQALAVLHTVLSRSAQQELMLDDEWKKLGHAVQAEHNAGQARAHIVDDLKDFFARVKGRGGQSSRNNELAMDAVSAAVTSTAGSKGLKAPMAAVLGVSTRRLERGAELRGNMTAAAAAAAPSTNTAADAAPRVGDVLGGTSASGHGRGAKYQYHP